MQKLIYVVDDEENIRLMMKTFLENEGFLVESFGDGTSVREAVSQRRPDMIVLDIMMPGEDGLSLCKAFRKEKDMLLLIVSAKDSPLDRVTGLMLGSDDYVAKPFLPLEFITRVKALFRRAEIEAAGTERENGAREVFSCGNLSIYPRERRIVIGGNECAVTPNEFEFLLYLMERRGTAVSRDELLEHVWDCHALMLEQRMPDDLVKRLRKKMKNCGSTARVETIWGYGYRLTEVPVQG